MKKLIFAVSVAVITLIGARSASAADGGLSYDAASSSWVVHGVTVSTFTVTDISTNTALADRMQEYRSISWYSWTFFNVHSSSFSYKFTIMDSTTAPSITCSVGGGAPVGAGVGGSPTVVTEQTVGMKPWMLYCGSAEAKIGVRQGGR